MRFHTRVVECNPSAIHVDMNVEIVSDEQDDGIVIPFWRPLAHALSVFRSLQPRWASHPWSIY